MRNASQRTRARASRRKIRERERVDSSAVPARVRRADSPRRDRRRFSEMGVKWNEME